MDEREGLLVWERFFSGAGNAEHPYNYKEINQQCEKFSYLRDRKSSILQQNYPACTRRNTIKLLLRPAKQYFQRYEQVIVEMKHRQV